jgi:hypothetical protein
MGLILPLRDGAALQEEIHPLHLGEIEHTAGNGASDPRATEEVTHTARSIGALAHQFDLG